MDQVNFSNVELLPCSCGFIGQPNAITLAALNEPAESLHSFDSLEEELAWLHAEED